MPVPTTVSEPPGAGTWLGSALVLGVVGLVGLRFVRLVGLGPRHFDVHARRDEEASPIRIAGELFLDRRPHCFEVAREHGLDRLRVETRTLEQAAWIAVERTTQRLVFAQQEEEVRHALRLGHTRHGGATLTTRARSCQRAARRRAGGMLSRRRRSRGSRARATGRSLR